MAKAKTKTYLVPVDFSKGAEAALDHAIAMARENNARVILLHVIPMAMVYPSEGTSFDFYGLLERDARENFTKLMRRKRLPAEQFRVVVERGVNPAEIIARHAKKLKAAMIIMGSHGRTGLQRLILGSVAERTIRYSDGPVLIVKR
jgi:nucleotide-binding universal stress UspA family protein